jgi:hypothetical protein
MEQSATVEELCDLSELERFARLAQYLVPMTQSAIERRLSGLKEHPHLMRAMSLSQPTPSKNDDPTKVVRSAPRNAASVASLRLAHGVHHRP